MTKLEKTIGLVIAGIVVGLLFTVMGQGGQDVGGIYSNVQKDFSEGISVNKTVVIDGSRNVTAAALTASGNITGQGESNLFGNAVSSTVQVGAASKSGCLVLGDSANGASVVYITATGATLTASTTKPAACQTAQ